MINTAVTEKIRSSSLVAVVACVSLVITACATSPEGRSQLKLLPEDQINSMGVQSFEQIKQQTAETKDPKLTAYIQCIANAIIPQLDENNQPGLWEIRVFEDDQANAFALPGNKIGVYEGLMKYAVNQHQVATVMGHELAHVIAQHGNERVSEQLAAQAGLTIAAVALGSSSTSDDNKKLILAGLGLGVQYGVILPFSRTHESEADLIGVELMARSGFDPRESVKLWENMAKAGAQPPEFLSTHPSSSTRIKELNNRMPRALDLYSKAQAQNRRPDCRLEITQ
jgi:predicted Zn-dependent protease